MSEVSRRELYQDLLKKKGRYFFVYGRVGDEEIEYDEEERFKKLMDGVEEGKEVMFFCHFVWTYGSKHSIESGNLTGVIDKIVEYDYDRGEFVIISKVKRYPIEDRIGYQTVLNLIKEEGVMRDE